MQIPLLYRGEYSQWSERFMNYLEEQMDGEAMINSIKNGDQPLPRVTHVSIARTSSTEQPPLKDKLMCNKTAKDLWDALARHMFGSEYGEQDRKAAVLYEYKTFKATERELSLDTYIRYLQYAKMMRQNKNLLDINIDALYNILKQNQGDVNDAMKSKKKAVVITSDPLALVAEQTKVSKRKEKVVVSSESEGSDDELKKITALLDINRKKFYSKPTNNNLKISSATSLANKKQEYVKSDDKKEEKKFGEKKRDMSKVKCYNCKKEGHFAKDCKKAKVKDYKYYKTKMLLAKKDKDEQVLLAEDHAWMESSKASSSSSNDKIVEVSYYTSESESECEYETSDYYDNSTTYGLFMDNNDDQEIFHDSSENFSKTLIESQIDHNESDVTHNDSEDVPNKDFENQTKFSQEKCDVLQNQTNIFEVKNNELNEQIKVSIEKNDDLLAQTKVLQEQLKVKHVVIDNHVESNEFTQIVCFECDFKKIIIDLEDEVMSLLDKEKDNLKIIESLKSKGCESSENEISESENQSENDCQVVEKGCDNSKNSSVIALGMFKLCVSQSVSPISVTKTSCASNSVETKLKRKRRKRTSSKHNDKQVNKDVLRVNKDFVHFSDFDTLSSVRRPKPSGIIWKKKKGSSNTVKADLFFVNHLNSNKNVKRYSCKDLMLCNNSHLRDTQSAHDYNNARNAYCNSYDVDVNDLFVFDDVSLRKSHVSKMPFRKKASASLNVPSTNKLNKSLPRIVRKWLPKLQPLAEPVAKWIPRVTRCSKHITGNRALLTNFVKKFLGMVRFGNNDFSVIAGYGDVVIGSMMIKKFYYVEGLRHNLFSVGQFYDNGLEVAFRKSTCFVRTEDGVDLLTGDRSSNLHTMALNKVTSNSSACLLANAFSLQSWLWHQRLSHLNFATINNLVKNNLVQGLSKMKFKKDHLCFACEQAKIHRKHHKSKMAFASNKPLYLLHVDLCGPMRVESINEKRYVLVVVDDYSRYTWVFFLHSKDEASEFFDVRTPQQNGVVERRNRTLVEAARTMLTFANLPLFLWAESISTACFIQNRSIIHKHFVKTPYELMNKRKANFKFFHVFGCRCYLFNDYDDVGKLKAKRDIGVFVGYLKESASFRIYNKRTRKIHESVNVNFNEISEMASKQFSLEPDLTNLNEKGKSSNLTVS
nr:hypothetical protein [Tanacetum cinerariifolium]